MSRSAAWWDRHAGYDQNLWIDHPFEGAAYLPRWTKTRDTPAVRHRREGTPMLTVVTDENAHAHMAAGLDEIVREGASSPCRRSAALHGGDGAAGLPGDVGQACRSPRRRTRTSAVSSSS